MESLGDKGLDTVTGRDTYTDRNIDYRYRYGCRYVVMETDTDTDI